MHRHRQRLTQAVRERLLIPLRQLSGLEIAVAVAIGIIGGVFPVPLVTSLVTLFVGWCLRCSAAELVVGSSVNLFCTPLQFALLPSFARLTGTLRGEDTTAYTAAALRAALSAGYVAFLQSCGRMIVYATLAWCFVFLPVVFVLRHVQRYAAHRVQQREHLRFSKAGEVYVSDEV